MDIYVPVYVNGAEGLGVSSRPWQTRRIVKPEYFLVDGWPAPKIDYAYMRMSIRPRPGHTCTFGSPLSGAYIVVRMGDRGHNSVWRRQNNSLQRINLNP